jgi:hypothetical protein
MTALQTVRGILVFLNVMEALIRKGETGNVAKSVMQERVFGLDWIVGKCETENEV